MAGRLSELSYRLSDPASLKGLLYDIALSVLFTGISIVLFLTDSGSESIVSHPVQTVGVAGICFVAGIVGTSVFHRSERLRKLWSSNWIRFMIIFGLILCFQALLSGGYIIAAELLVGAISLMIGAIIMRTVLYVRRTSA